MFEDRNDAAMQLAQLIDGADFDILLALPRGGVPIAAVISERSGVAMDVLIVRKLGTPLNPELAFGAIAEHGKPVFNQAIITSMHIPKLTVAQVITEQKQEIARRSQQYRPDKAPLELDNKRVLLIDDGVATGATVKAAYQCLHHNYQLQSLSLAVPVIAADSYEELMPLFDKIITLNCTAEFYAVGQFYDYFDQVSDSSVIALLNKS